MLAQLLDQLLVALDPFAEDDERCDRLAGHGIGTTDHGSLGNRLLLRVVDVMRKGAEIPKVTPDVLLSEGLLEMTQKGLGMTAIVDADDRILGIFTDGDLRRALDAGVFFVVSRFFNRVDFLEDGGESERVNRIYTIGVTLGARDSISIWKIDFDRVGIDYRWGNAGFRGIGFNLGFWLISYVLF